MKAPKLLKLDDAVKIAVRCWDVDPLLAEQAFEPRTYFPVEDVYGAGFYEGFHYAINILLKEAESEVSDADSD